jgi:hypothetical protein
VIEAYWSNFDIVNTRVHAGADDEMSKGVIIQIQLGIYGVGYHKGKGKASPNKPCKPRYAQATRSSHVRPIRGAGVSMQIPKRLQNAQKSTQ